VFRSDRGKKIIPKQRKTFKMQRLFFQIRRGKRQNISLAEGGRGKLGLFTKYGKGRS